MDENRKPPTRQHNVRRSRQIASVEAESCAEGVQRSTDPEFGRSVFRPNGRHHTASHGWGDDVGHAF
jgi:hypothetical protein